VLTGTVSFTSPNLTGSVAGSWNAVTAGSLIQVCSSSPCNAPFYASTLSTVNGGTTSAIPSILYSSSFANQQYVITPAIIQFVPHGAVQGSTTDIEAGSSIESLNIDCNTLAASIGIQNWKAQEQSYVQDVNIGGCLGIGLDVETIHAQNSGPYRDLFINVGTAPSPFNTGPYSVTLCAELLKTGDLRGIHGLTCTPELMTTTPADVGVDLSTTSTTLEDIHIEGFTTGIEIGSHDNANNITLINITGGTGAGPMTTVVDVANSSFASGIEFGAFGLSAGVAGHLATNTLVDNISSATLASSADPAVSFYVLGSPTGTARNRITSSPNVSSVLRSPSLTSNPLAPTQLITDNSTKIATTAFTKQLFGTWSDGTSNISLGTLGAYAFGQWTTPGALGITVTGFDMTLLTAPAGCTTQAQFSIVDSSASDNIIMTITTVNTQLNYSTTGSATVPASHTLKFKVTRAGASCATQAATPTATLTYSFQ
jgi:hypothetical protein